MGSIKRRDSRFRGNDGFWIRGNDGSWNSHCGIEPTTVIDLTGDVPQLVREGMGLDHGLG